MENAAENAAAAATGESACAAFPSARPSIHPAAVLQRRARSVMVTDAAATVAALEECMLELRGLTSPLSLFLSLLFVFCVVIKTQIG